MPTNSELTNAVLMLKKHCVNTMCENCIFREEKNYGTGCIFSNINCPQDLESEHCNLTLKE